MVQWNSNGMASNSRSKMSLAGKMLHCVHLRSWSEIAKRWAGLKELVPWSEIGHWETRDWLDSLVKRIQRKTWGSASKRWGHLKAPRNPSVLTCKALLTRRDIVHVTHVSRVSQTARPQEGKCVEFVLEADIMRLVLGRWDAKTCESCESWEILWCF